MTELCKIVAVEKGAKERFTKVTTALHRSSNDRDKFEGMTKVYQPLDEEGQKYPTERKEIQATVKNNMEVLKTELSDLCRLVGTKDYGNTQACANVMLDDKVIVKNAPVPFLLFLDKRLVDLRTAVQNLPTLDPTAVWKLDDVTGLYKSDPYQTLKSTKEEVPLVMYDSTDKHPAQVKTVTKDITIGTWTNTRFSGAIKRTDKEAFLSRIECLIRSVKVAREEANSKDVEVEVFHDFIDAIFNY